MMPTTHPPCLAPSRRVTWRMGAALLAMLLVLPPLAGTMASAEPNPFERREIEQQALESFKRMVRMWQEELYFELYDLGIKSTQARISRQDFAQRMVELSWVPDGELNPKYLESVMRFRTMVYVNTRILYRNKFNPAERFAKDQVVLLLQEDGEWRLDLVALIRSPYAT